MRTFSTGATRDSDDTKNDYEGFLSPHALTLFGDYMTKHRKQADGNLRDSDNWQKGMPRAQYAKSAWRHFMDFWTEHRSYVEGLATGEVDQSCENAEMVEALCALFFNIQGYLHEYAIARDVGVEPEAEPLKLAPDPMKWQHLHLGFWLDCGTTTTNLPDYVNGECTLPQDVAHVQAEARPTHYRYVSARTASGARA